MNVKYLIITTLFVSILFGACTAWSMGKRQRSTQAKHNEYSCPMHPQITSDKPGNCSICGMALVKKDSDSKATKEGHTCSCCGMKKK